MKRAVFFTFFILTSALVRGVARRTGIPKKPALVIGIVVDQMRQDFLYRYASGFGKDGFRRFLNQGYSFRNCQYSYTPTYTGPGHASVFTGSTPAVHGIVGNDWLQASGKPVYCTSDSLVSGIGTNGKAGKMSPANLQSETLADQIRLSGQFRGKAFGISLKDRGAILPAGHAANAAFWFDFSSGQFISSTWYRELKGKLPSWLEKFNQSAPAVAYRDSVWKPLLPLFHYSVSDADNAPWEKSLISGREPIFPYSMRDAGGVDKVAHSPFGNTLLTRLALTLMDAEGLGRDSITDFLSVSYSSTDIVGHAYGPSSMENQDSYLRLDRELEALFRFLDSKIGKGKWLCFLTSDHGVMEAPGYLRSHQIPAFSFSEAALKDSLQRKCLEFCGKDMILGVENLQVYWKKDFFQLDETEQHSLEKKVLRWLEAQPAILRAFSFLGGRPFPEPPMLRKVEAGYYAGRSGHLQMVLKPQYLNHAEEKGTTHGSPFVYDSHVPCLFTGWKIGEGSDYKPFSIEDITPTLCQLLEISYPSGCTGKPHELPISK